jgi:carbonic anhydrase
MSHPAPPRPGERSGPWGTLRADLPASFVVFLVAVPLSLGIALASGAPILAGIVAAAVVGGVVAGLLGGSPLQVTGPAAGLTVVVAELVARFGWATTCLITVGAGLLQVVLGLLRVGRYAAAIPPAVVHGMLAGIGISIALAQLHVVLGSAPRAGVAQNAAALPAALGALEPAALAVGLVTVVVILLWPRVAGPLRAVPAPLVAIVAATALAATWPGAPQVDLPGDLLASVTLPLLPEGDWGALAGGVLTVALIASVESLLSAVAVDRMHTGPRTRVDRELVGQGAANAVSGMLGGLPVTGVIVRSSANVAAGARTRLSTVLHGVWIAVFALLLAGLVETIPLAALAGLLVVVGCRLVDPHDVRTARAHGELVVYLGTVAGVLALNLLEGVAIGLALAGLLVLRRAVRARVRVEAVGDGWWVTAEGLLSFLSVPSLSRELAKVPAGTSVRVDLRVDYLDHAGRDHLTSWATRHRAGGGRVEIIETRRHGRRAARRAGGTVSPLPPTLHRDVRAAASPVR